MTLKFRYSESTVRPELIEFGKTTVYIHRNITEEQRTDPETQTTTTWYVYDEAALSYEQYTQYQNEQRLNDIEDVMAEIIGGGEV